MPGAARLGDVCTGHGAWPPRPNVSASGDVIINGIGAHRQGDSWAVHCNPTPSCHASVLAAGSGTVFINGRQAGRIGDPVACGSSVASGSGDVIIGG